MINGIAGDDAGNHECNRRGDSPDAGDRLNGKRSADSYRSQISATTTVHFNFVQTPHNMLRLLMIADCHDEATGQRIEHVICETEMTKATTPAWRACSARPSTGRGSLPRASSRSMTRAYGRSARHDPRSPWAVPRSRRLLTRGDHNRGGASSGVPGVAKGSQPRTDSSAPNRSELFTLMRATRAAPLSCLIKTGKCQS